MTDQTRVPMAAFMRKLSRQAEKTFARYGGIDMSWVAITADGREALVGTPVTKDAKDDLAERMRTFFKEHGVVRFGCVYEAWGAPGVDPQRPSEHPDRMEIIGIQIEDISGEMMMGMRRIMRPAGGKPYLAALELDEQGAPPVGRFSGLLLPDYATMPADGLIDAMRANKALNPRARQALYAEISRRMGVGEPRVRGSFELPADEGTVFVARDPAAPIEVMGRRAQSGELCIGAIMVPRPHLDLDAAPIPVELVTGPEAERLISLVLAKLAANAMPTEADRRSAN